MQRNQNQEISNKRLKDLKIKELETNILKQNQKLCEKYKGIKNLYSLIKYP